jgi:YD repeat-containing protein
VGSLQADTWTYDAVGNVMESTQDGITTTQEYNAFNEEIQETCRGCGPGGADAITHRTYDNGGRLTSMVDARASGPDDDTHTWSYEYDGEGRLRTAQLPAPISATTTIVYDDAGERVKVTDGADKARYYTYDERGRLKTLASARGTLSYTYDHNDRLVQVDLPPSTPPLPVASLHYSYDNLGQRTRRWPVGPSVEDVTVGWTVGGDGPAQAVTVRHRTKNHLMRRTIGPPLKLRRDRSTSAATPSRVMSWQAPTSSLGSSTTWGHCSQGTRSALPDEQRTRCWAGCWGGSDSGAGCGSSRITAKVTTSSATQKRRLTS